MKFIKKSIENKPLSSGLLLTLLSGVLIALSHVPFWPILMFLAYIPMWIYWVYTPRFFAGLCLSVLCEFLVHSIIFYWLGTSIATFVQVDPSYGHVAAMVINFFTSYNFFLTFFLWRALLSLVSASKVSLASLLMLPVLHILVEAFSFKMFPKNFGYSWYYGQWPGYQFADIIGIEAIGFLSLCASVVFLYAMIRTEKPAIGLSLATIVGIVLINLLGSVYGSWREEGFLALEREEISFLLVQPNISNEMKLKANKKPLYQIKMVDQQISATQQGMSRVEKEVDLIIWPETAFPYTFDAAFSKKHVNHMLEEYLNMIKTPLLTGAYSRKGTQKDQNAAFLVGLNNGTAPQVYSKQILVPFGEFLPMPKLFGWLKPYLHDLTTYEVTKDFQLFQLNGINLGVLICYEDMFSEYTRQVFQKGAQIFVNISNDKWFGETIEPMQHYIYGAARTVEFRLPMVRVSNGGYSGMIDELGNFQVLSPLAQEWSDVASFFVVKNPEPTFFFKYGHLITYVYILILPILLFCSSFLQIGVVFRKQIKKGQLQRP